VLRKELSGLGTGDTEGNGQSLLLDRCGKTQTQRLDAGAEEHGESVPDLGTHTQELFMTGSILTASSKKSL
jgi:hypothetical protein